MYLYNYTNFNDNFNKIDFCFTFSITNKGYKIIYVENNLLCDKCYKKRNVIDI